MTRLIRFLAALCVSCFGLASGASAYEAAGYLAFPNGYTNYFAPANGYVPPGYDNETSPFVTFPGTFGFSDGSTLVTASFAPGYTLTIEETTSSGSGLMYLDFFETSLPPKFHDYRLVESTFQGLPWVNLDGALIIDLPAMGPGAAMATFAFGAPEPATWSMLFFGFVGLAWMALRRRSRMAISRVCP